MTPILLVALGSALGASARYGLDLVIQSRHDRVFPWGTWTINVSGSLVLGVIVGLATQHELDPQVTALTATGFLGGYTTFSTFTWETLRLVEDGAGWTAMRNVVTSCAAGIGAAAFGLVLGGLG